MGEIVTGERFGPYELARLIGRGGMGEVFEAYDTEQDRTVALKRLVPHMVHDEEFQRRFRRESKLAARLRSPHVVPIHRFGEINGQLFIDMRLVEGCDLEQLLTAEGRLAPERAVAIIEQVAWALDAAHAAGLIHRDIKPSNVLLDTASGGHEFVYLADFGITRALGGESVSLTSTHAVLGSLDYMAPEQFDGLAAPAIDIYSLGCLLFHCLTGSKPFPVEGLPALMRAHLTKPAPLPSQCGEGLGEAFDEVIARALAKDPDERYQSAGAVGAAARAALAATPTVVLTTADRTAARADSAGTRIAPLRGTEAVALPAPSRIDDAAALGASAARGGTEVRPGALVGAGSPSAPTSEGPMLDGVEAGASVFTASKAATITTPRRDSVPPALGDGASPDPAPSPAPEQGPAAERGVSTPPSPPMPPFPPTPQGGAPGPGGTGAAPVAPWRRRGVLVAGVAVGLVVILGLAALVGTTVFGGHASTNHSVQGGATGQGAVPLAPPAPTLHSADVPTVSGTFSVGNGPEAIALSPDGTRAYVTGESGANVLNVVDTAHGTVLATIPAPGPPQFIVMDPAGARGYVTLWDPSKNQNSVAVFDVARNAFTAVIPTGMQRPFGLGISPDGAKLYVPDHDSGQITVIDTASATVTAQIPVPPNPHWIAFSPTGRIAYAANHMANVVTVLDTKTDSVIGVIPIGNGNMVSPHSIAVSPDGRRVEVTQFDGNAVSTIDTATNQVLRTVPVGANPQSVVFARDGAHSYVVNNASNSLTVLSSSTGAATATVPLGTSPWMAAVSPDGRFAYVTNKETNAITVLSIAH